MVKNIIIVGDKCHESALSIDYKLNVPFIENIVNERPIIDKIKDAKIETSSWVVASRGEIQKQTKYMLSSISDDKFLEKFKSSEVDESIVNALVASNHGSKSNYYHWLAQVVVSIAYCIKENENENENENANANENLTFDNSQIFILVHDPLTNYQIQWLSLLRVSDRCIYSKPSNNLLQVDTLYIPRLLYSPYDFNPSKIALAHLRQLVLGREVVKEWQQKLISKYKKIYISRKDSNNLRGIDSESVLESVLMNLGFDIFIASDWSIAAQVAIFSSAEVIVAPHGAGLTNIIFSSKKCKIIEINQDNYLNRCFSAIWKVIWPDSPYWHFVCPPSEFVQNKSENYHHQKTLLDTDGLIKLINSI
jgi:hypothetical protein